MTRPGTRIPLTVEQTQRLMDVHKLVFLWKGPRSTAVADALPLVASGRSHVVCVAGTGSGKSDCIWLSVAQGAAATPHRFVLLLVPYVPLVADVLEKARRRMIHAVRWNPSDSALPDNIGLVIASLNQAVGKPMMAWLARPDVSGRIKSVVVDEAHVLLDERSFRLVRI
jgi:replicative superfamily II helicase